MFRFFRWLWSENTPPTTCPPCPDREVGTPKFTVQEIERVITFHEDESYTETLDEGAVEPTDLRGALDALDSQCWDEIDLREDAVILLYPADSHMNPANGDDESTQVIVKARRLEWAERLLAIYEARKEAR